MMEGWMLSLPPRACASQKGQCQGRGMGWDEKVGITPPRYATCRSPHLPLIPLGLQQSPDTLPLYQIDALFSTKDRENKKSLNMLARLLLVWMDYMREHVCMILTVCSRSFQFAHCKCCANTTDPIPQMHRQQKKASGGAE